MSKTDRAKRRALKKAHPPIPELASTKKRGKDRCFVERTRQQPEEPANRLVLDKRAREMGEIPAAGKAGDNTRAKYASQALTDGATRALVIFGGAGSENELLALYGDFCAKHAAWCRSLGISQHAKTSKTEMMPEPFEVDVTARIDLRTPDERDEAADRAYAPYRLALREIGPAHEQAIWRAYHGWRHTHDGQKLTLSGRLFVAAMQAMQAALDK